MAYSGGPRDGDQEERESAPLIINFAPQPELPPPGVPLSEFDPPRRSNPSLQAPRACGQRLRALRLARLTTSARSMKELHGGEFPCSVPDCPNNAVVQVNRSAGEPDYFCQAHESLWPMSRQELERWLLGAELGGNR